LYLPGTGVFTRSGTTKEVVEQPDGEVTLNFENANLLEVIKVILGDLLSANYVVDPAVTGAVTLQTSSPLPRSALIPTLEELLRLNGAALLYADGLYNVVPADRALTGSVPSALQAKTGPPTVFGVRVVPLKFVSAVQMAKILEPFATPGNIVRVDEQRNLLILAGSSQELANLTETVELFDVNWLAGMSIALFRPQFVEVKTLAEELEAVFGGEAEGPLAGLVRLIPIERLNALMVMTPREQYLREARRWVERLDQDPGKTGRRLFIYRVQNGKAADLAQVLNDIFSERGQGAGLGRAEVAPGRVPAEIRSSRAETLPGVTGESVAQAAYTSAYQVTEGGQPSAAPEPVETAAERRASPANEASPRQAPTQGVAIPERPQGAAVAETEEPIRITADEVNNALLILATGAQYRNVLAALRGLDVTPLMVLIEVTIAEIILEDELRYGVEWFFKNNFDSKQGRGQLDFLDTIIPGARGFSYTVVAGANDIRFLLNALAVDSKLNLVSSPSLMVLNNQTANIQVGDEVPVTTQERIGTEITSDLVRTVEYRDTGVLLTVTPRVNPGGLVIMEVEQEVSNVREFTGGDPLTPTISQRKISSTVAVQSGATVVLGGLIREESEDSKQGVPGLYKVPVLGWLFGQTGDRQDRRELVVLITPRAVQDAAQAREVTEEIRAKMQSLKPVYEPDVRAPRELRERRLEAPRVAPSQGL
jgi:general secretion pathway protein D